MLRRLLTALTAAAACAAAVLVQPVPAAAAGTGACRPGGPRCHVWAGRVEHVSDGDTVDVDVFGDGTSAALPIRLIGVQAMEQSVHSRKVAKRRGECHALAATARLEQLISWGGGVVRLTAQHPAGASRGRALRSMAVKFGGQWRDVGQILIREGHALWMLSTDEWAWNAAYRYAQERAAADRRNLYAGTTCGSGPYQDAALNVWVNPDADGTDSINVNGEWIRVGNASAVAVPVGGWWVRDSGLRRYTFPPGTVIPARGAVFVHTGHGVDGDGRFHWRLTGPIFENPTWDEAAIGDGGYLFDPQGDLRAWNQYPCVARCRPLTGSVRITVAPGPEQLIRVVNTGQALIDLLGHTVVVGPHVYPITDEAVLHPGESFDLYAGVGTSAGLSRFWGSMTRVMYPGGGTVVLRDRGQSVDTCTAWGSGSC